DTVSLPHPISHRPGQVAHRGDLEAAVQLPQVMQVHHLRDESAADDTDAQSRLSEAARDYTPTTDDRSIRRVPEDLKNPIAVAGAPVSFGAFEVTVGV